jgi:hypothetical protein
VVEGRAEGDGRGLDGGEVVQRHFDELCLFVLLWLS